MSETNDRLTIGPTLTAAFATIGGEPLKFGLLLLVCAAFAGLADTYLGGGAGTWAGNIGIFIIGVLSTFQTLKFRFGPDEPLSPNIGMAFGVSILANLGVLLGFMLLIVPGLLLMVRWALATPVVIRENLGTTAALRRSAELTKGNRWRILGLALLIWVPGMLVIIAASALLGVFAGEAAENSLGFNLALNAMVAGLTIVSAVAFAEAYLTISGERDNAGALEEIFA